MRREKLYFCHSVPFLNMNFMYKSGSEFNTLISPEKKIWCT